MKRLSADSIFKPKVVSTLDYTQNSNTKCLTFKLNRSGMDNGEWMHKTGPNESAENVLT